MRIRGTGASCIYPLLGTKIGGWSFLATDIDETSLQHARHNVLLNRLENAVELRLVSPGSLLLGSFSFTFVSFRVTDFSSACLLHQGWQNQERNTRFACAILLFFATFRRPAKIRAPSVLGHQMNLSQWEAK